MRWLKAGLAVYPALQEWGDTYGIYMVSRVQVQFVLGGVDRT